MTIIMYKQRFMPPNDFNTPIRNYLHIGYIATRPRSMKNKYGEHALFGKYTPNDTCEDKTWQETARYVKKLSQNKVNIYRSIISFERKNSDELGLLTQKDWQGYCERHIRTLAEKNNIKIENLGYCGSFHNEGNHPHLHVVFWDNAQEVMVNYTPPKIPNEIRIALIKSTYEEKIKDFYEQKKNAKVLLGEMSDEAVAEFDAYMEKVYPKEFRRIQSEFERYDEKAERINITQLFNSDKQLAELTERLFKIRAMLPKGGRINYKLLPPEVKEEVDKLTDELLNSNTYLQNAVCKYVDIQMELKKLYQSAPDKLEEYRAKCLSEAKKLIGNRILKSVKMIILKEYETKTAEYSEAKKNYFAMELIHELLNFFAKGVVSGNSMYEDKKGIGGELSERAMKEWYLKNKDKGCEFY